MLASCANESLKDQDLEKKVVELEQQIEELKKNNEPEHNLHDNPESSKINDTEFINVIDPNTNQILRTFSKNDALIDEQQFKKEIEEWAKVLARGSDTESGYDKRMILDKINENGDIIHGSPMIILKESELVNKIIEISATGGDVKLPIYVTESGYSIDDIPRLNETIIASFTTYFNEKEAGRNKNIELSAAAINNLIVGSGDYFSFNTMVGPRTQDKGYQPATEIVNGEYVMGIGGGICQTSSTLFNVVDEIGVKIVERHHHSKSVGYVPKGRDATVSYGTLDFRFQNTTGVPILLTTIYENGSLTVEVRTSKSYAETL